MTTTSSVIPAAQYVRASTERQQYSIEYQTKIISQYAQKKGFEVIETFSDEARSGLDLKSRPALRHLLAEVIAGQSRYRAILVFDVSRWGRFQDTDEAAHYEYVCKTAGIPIHYCAEPFGNTGEMSDTLLKTLKRFMAGEYSRDLSARTMGGTMLLVQKGFKYGSVPGYGLRRMLVAADGKRKHLLEAGEVKSISSDHVVFVPGPEVEQACVREIYRQFVEDRKPMTEIARDLNRRNIPFTSGSAWSPTVIKLILSHPKYIGTLVFNRTERKLQSPQRRTDRSKWLVIPNTFEPIVEEHTFRAAQKVLDNFTRKKSNQRLLDDLKNLLAEKGKLSIDLLRDTPGMASLQTYVSRMGSLRNAYKQIGYDILPWVAFREQLISVRKRLMREVLALFPNEVSMPPRKTKYLQLKDGPLVLVYICRSFNLKAGRRWLVRFDGSSIGLAAMMDKDNVEVESMYVLPPHRQRQCSVHSGSALLRSGTRLDGLLDFCQAARTVEGTT